MALHFSSSREHALVLIFCLCFIPNSKSASLPRGWEKLSDSLLTGANIAHLDAGISKYVWALDYSGKPHAKVGLRGQWTAVNDLEIFELSWVSSGAAGVWGVQRKFGVPAYREGISELQPVGTRWSSADGRGFMIIESGLRGCVYALTRTGELYYRDGITEQNKKGTSWRQIWGTYRFISVGSYGVWTIDFYDRIYFGQGSSAHLSLIKNWKQVDTVPASGIRSVVSGFDGSVWALTGSGDVFQRKSVNVIKPTGNPGWKRVDGVQLKQITAGLPGVLGITNQNDLVVHQDRKCGGLLEETSGIFATPNYLSLYPNNVVCLWVIRVPQAKSIIVTLEVFDVGQDSGDFLAYSDGGINPTNEKPKLVTNPGRKEIYFQGDTALFEFVSDGNLSSKGFFARYNSDLRNNKQGTDKPTTQPFTPFSGCGGSFNQESGKFTTPNYPDNYGSDLDCTWYISVEPNKKISLSFSDISIEDDSGCRFDYLRIGDGLTKNQNTRETACGKRTLDFVSKGNEVWIHFFSDATVQSNGFKASWMTVMMTTTQITTTTMKTTRADDVMKGWNSIPVNNPMMNQIDSGMVDQIAALDSNGKASLYVNNIWIQISNDALSYITSGDSGIWALDSDGRALYRSGIGTSYPSGTKWEKIGNDIFTQIDSGPKGFVFAIRGNGVAAYREGISDTLPFGTRWINLSQKLKSVSVGTYALWAIDLFGNVLFATRPSKLGLVPITWRSLPGLQLKAIEAGFGNSIWGITTAGGIFQRDGVTHDTPYGTYWKTESGLLSDVTVGLPGVFGLTASKRLLARQDTTRFCGGILSARSGRMLSPGYPFTSYPIGTHCLWVIRVPSANRITLSFQLFDVYQTNGCLEDYLLLYKRGRYSPESGVDKYCSSVINSREFTFQGNEVWVQFNAGNRPSSFQPRGFSISYNAEVVQTTAKPSTTVTTSSAPRSTTMQRSTETHSGCGGKFTSNFGSLTSPGYPVLYANNLRCTWTIEVDLSRELTLRFDDFDVEEDLTCRFDFLLIKSSENNGKELGKFCGKVTPVDIKVGGNKVWILFKSDDTVSRRGFRVNWSSKQTTGTTSKTTMTTPTKATTFKVTTKFSKTDPDTGLVLPLGWSQVPIDIEIGHIDGGISPNAWAIDQEGRPYMEDGSNWRLVGLKTMKWITSGGSGVWAVDKSGVVFFRRGIAPLAPMGAYWEMIESPRMDKIDSGPMGSVLALDSAGDLYLRMGVTAENPKGTGWRKIGSGYRHLTVSSYGYWVVDLQNKIFFAPHAKSGQLSEYLRWVPVSGTFDQVKAGFGGSLWAVTPSGELYQREGITAIIPIGQSWKREGNLKINGVSAGMSGIFASVAGTNKIIKKIVPECGGIFTAPRGSFKTPNHARHYPPNTSCLWQIKVPGANKIIVEFESFKLQEKTDGTCNKDFLLYLRDGDFPSAFGIKKRCDYDDAPIVFEGDKAWLEFVSNDDSFQFPGFNATYSSVVDPGRVTAKPLIPSKPVTQKPTTIPLDLYTGCGGLIDAVSASLGQFAHPSYPADYQKSQNCEYIIRALPGQRILLDFNMFDLEGTSDCRYDYLEIRDGETSSDTLIGKYCGKRDLKGIKSKGNALFVKFKSDVSSEFKGYRATWRVENPYTTTTKPATTTNNGLEGPRIEQIYMACGGSIDAKTKTLGYIAHPGYPGKYDTNNACTYVIKTMPGKTLKLSFEKFALESHDSCSFDYLEIRAGDNVQSPSLGRFCGKKNPGNIISNGDSLFIKFVSDYATNDDGFLLKWDVELDNTLPTVNPKISTEQKDNSPITTCGGNFMAPNGLFATPNYPENYSPRLNCIWTIRVNEKKKVELSFEFFDIEKSGITCLYDYVEVFDFNPQSTAAKSLGKFCDKMPEEIVSAGSQLRVLFHSDNLRNRKGFVARWMEVGSSLKTTPRSTVTEKPCFQRLSGFGGEISSDGLTTFYAPNQNCSWSIIVSRRNKIKIEFDFFELESSFACSKDSMTIYDGPTETSRVIMNLCGSSKPTAVFSSGNQLLIRFKTDATNNARGFKLRWSAVPQMTDQPVTTVVTAAEIGSLAEICTQKGYLTGSSGTVTSLGYPNNYPANRRCSLGIRGQPNSRISVKFEDLAIESSTGCRNDALVVDSANGKKRFCGYTLPADFKTIDNLLLLTFTSDFSYSGRGFKLSWKQESLTPTTASGLIQAPMCGGRLYGSSGSLRSPKFNRQYQFPVTCTWILEVGRLSKINFQLQSADFKGRDCSSSYLLFRDGVSSSSRPLKLFCGGESLLPFKSGGNIVYIETRIGENKNVEFVMNWNEETDKPSRDLQCGGMKTMPTGMIRSPGFPATYQSNLVCTWVILAPKGKKIAMDFTAFELENDQRCSKDSLTIRNGETSYGGLVGRYCGRSIPKVIMSSGNSVWLQLHTDCKSVSRGFTMKWNFFHGSLKTSEQPTNIPRTTRSPRNTRTILPPSTASIPLTQQPITNEGIVNAQGGLITGQSGVIQSPNYPRKYPNNMDIVWVLKGPGAGRIALSFRRFSLEEDSACRYDYVQLRDGSAADSPSIGKFCGSNLPATYTSADNALWVKFLSDGSDNSVGFQAEWKWLPSGDQLPDSRTERRQINSACGGVLNQDEGEFSTPNYPSRYSPNSECVWLIKPKTVAQSIELRFKSFSLEAEARCGYDFVEVKDGDSRSSPSIGRFCGAMLPNVLLSRGGALWIRFKSDSSTNEQGFLASWKMIRRKTRGIRSISIRALDDPARNN